MKTNESGLAGATRSMTCSRIGFPATVTNGFGLLQVSGRKRVPNPATGKMTSITTPLAFNRQVSIAADDPTRRYNFGNDDALQHKVAKGPRSRHAIRIDSR